MIHLRRGTVDDAGPLASFATRAFSDTYASFNTPENMQAYLAASFGVPQQRRELSDPRMITVLAERDRELVGFAQVKAGDPPACVAATRTAEVYRFYVDRSAHGTGVAQRMMRGAKDAARELGATHLWLGVWERNPRAIAFYGKEGFTPVGQQIFQLGDDPQTDIVMLLSW